MSTKTEVILNTFQNRKLALAEWETMADQVLKRGVQKVADELRGKNLSVGERDEKFDPTPGASDDSSVEEADVKLSAKNHNALKIQSNIPSKKFLRNNYQNDHFKRRLYKSKEGVCRVQKTKRQTISEKIGAPRETSIRKKIRLRHVG